MSGNECSVVVKIDTTQLENMLSRCMTWTTDEIEKQIKNSVHVSRLPVCPDCGEVMTKTHYQNEEGDWVMCWLCGCESSVGPSLGLDGKPE